VIEFLTSLTEEGLLALDPVAAAWSWDLGRIRGKGYTDNIIDLMVGKLHRLPHTTQEMLQQLACLGGSTEIATLSHLARSSVRDIHAVLGKGINQNACAFVPLQSY
jgi:predicted ATPase